MPIDTPFHHKHLQVRTAKGDQIAKCLSQRHFLTESKRRLLDQKDKRSGLLITNPSTIKASFMPETISSLSDKEVKGPMPLHVKPSILAHSSLSNDMTQVTKHVMATNGLQNGKIKQTCCNQYM